MKPKKYKHKKTGLIFEQYDLRQVNSGYISGTTFLPSWLVVDSCDFEEVKEILFTTEDGVEITNGDDPIWTIEISKVGMLAWDNSYSAVAAKRNLGPLLKRFSSSQARDNYLLQNKPLFSVKDVMDYIRENFQRDGTGKLVDYPDLEMRAKRKLNATS